MSANGDGEAARGGRSVFERAAAAVLDLLVPSRCISCRRPRRSVGGGGACRRCWARLPRIPENEACDACGLLLYERVCPCCGRAPLGVDRGAAVALYEPPVPRLVGALKFRGYDILGPRVAREMADLAAARGLLDGVDAVTFIPSTRDRNRRRGFDPAGLLATAVARRLSRPLVATLTRVKSVPPQSTLPASSRRHNMKGVFRARAAASGLSLLLVDDVVTTGATVAAAASALREGGARRLHLLAFARTPETRAALAPEAA